MEIIAKEIGENSQVNVQRKGWTIQGNCDITDFMIIQIHCNVAICHGKFVGWECVKNLGFIE